MAGPPPPQNTVGCLAWTSEAWLIRPITCNTGPREARRGVHKTQKAAVAEIMRLAVGKGKAHLPVNGYPPARAAGGLNIEKLALIRPTGRELISSFFPAISAENMSL